MVLEILFPILIICFLWKFIRFVLWAFGIVALIVLVTLGLIAFGILVASGLL